MKSFALSIIGLVSGLFLLNSCTKDKCSQTITYTKYVPQYMSYEELRSSVKSIPAQPLKNPGKIYLMGNYIFVNEVDKGIHVINNSNPSSPQNVAFIQIPGNIDIAAKGNVLYADSYVDLLGLDISNPNNINVLKRIEDALPQRRLINGASIDPQKGVVTHYKDELVTEDVNNDCNVGGGYWGGGPIWMEGDVVNVSSGTMLPSVFTAAPQSGVAGSLARFALNNNTLYVVDDNNLRVFDISAPANPLANGTAYIGRNIETIFPYNNHLFIGSTNGMFIYNISNPTAPTYVSTYIHGTACDPVVVDGDYAYITLRSGTPCNTALNQLEVVDIKTLTNPVLKHTVEMSNPHGLGKWGDVLYVCDGNAGLKVMDAKTPETIPANPVVQVTSINATDVIPFNNRLLMIGTDGLYQYDISNPLQINYLSRITVEK